MKMALEVGENLTREDRLRLTGPALGAFFSVADRWGLSAEEEAKILGLATPSIAKRWRGRRPVIVRLPVLVRISCVLGIFRALNSIFSDRAQADGWLRRPNAAPLFAGECALDRIQSGELGDLLLVRRYLEAEF
jgi:hypothetical protein